MLDYIEKIENPELDSAVNSHSYAPRPARKVAIHKTPAGLSLEISLSKAYAKRTRLVSPPQKSCPLLATS